MSDAPQFPAEVPAEFPALSQPEASVESSAQETVAALGLTPPEGASIDDNLLRLYEQKALSAGLDRTQAESLMQWWLEQTQSHQQHDEQAKLDAVASLQRDWGGHYEQRLAEARHAVRQFGGQELADFLEQSGLGDHPALIKAFAEVGRRTGEDRMAGKGQNGFALSPAQAKSEVNRLFSDKAFLTAYTDPRHVGHDDAVARMVRLNQLAAS